MGETERERDREKERQRERDRKRDRERGRERGGGVVCGRGRDNYHPLGEEVVRNTDLHTCMETGGDLVMKGEGKRQREREKER